MSLRGEMVDTHDLKSCALKCVPVQIRSKVLTKMYFTLIVTDRTRTYTRRLRRSMPFHWATVTNFN